MACPFFVPSRRLEIAGWVRPPRLPLGDPFAGACYSQPAEIVEPPESLQRELCNCGYARGRCDRFPSDREGKDAPPDAVRFSVTNDEPNQLALVYVVEKDHSPVSHGILEYVVAEARLEGPLISDILAQQARAFLESYLRRRARSASV